MNPALTERAEEVFFSALQIKTPAERQDYLARECQDKALRALVENLLAAQANATSYFEGDDILRLPIAQLGQSLAATPAVAENLKGSERPDDFVGQSIGPYRLLQRIGEGGCGAVYMAAQEKPVQRRVAVKIIKLGMDTKSVIGRFEAERQALALMDHPNIARVLDAGATETGRPYFVMELVRGIKITEYCDENELDATHRLKLFIKVCHAIQHAHQKGIIHRDIKPSNILVTIIDGEPVPKVIDFGIAKAIEGRLTDQTIFTAYDQFIGTPAYMSPEQAVMSGTDVDTRSDIYSLGVLLYELLTGRPPFDTKELLDRGIDSMRRMLQEREPQRPSAMVTTLQGAALTRVAQSRHTEPLKLISTLRGDLDWIVIRALEKDRGRRYETANGMAMDVQRFLDNEPVLARPPSQYYRLQKLIRRNKMIFAFGALVMAVLFGWVGTSTWLLRQEREARKQAVAAEQAAVAAEQQQARLRREAEDGERIAEANFLIEQGKLAEADELVSKVSFIKPSLETESVLHKLGEWHAHQGQWPEAAERFKLLLAADQKIQYDSWAITDDLLMTGPVLIELGDFPGYEEFRRGAIARFRETTDPLFAERTLKISLLTTADADQMTALEKFYNIAAPTAKKGPGNELITAARCISLALMDYRRESFPNAKSWCRQAMILQNPTNLCITAEAYLIQGMSDYRSGQTREAQQELAKGRELIEGKFATGISQNESIVEGYWCDWLFARIILREAQALIEPAKSSPAL
ncbi:MAG TPA: serine/threonine-protein kinase [Verrucomicrobiae bacterium]